jgi:hypothetical protein
MKALILVFLALTPAIAPDFAQASNTQYQVLACQQDSATTADLEEDRQDAEIVELRLQDAKGSFVGSLFASWTNKGELYGHHIRLCGKGDNYFYVNADDLRNWAGEETELKTVSVMETNSTLNTDSIHHDEAVSLVAVETLSRTDDSAEVRVIFQAWNFASEYATTGIFTTTIPLKK